MKLMFMILVCLLPSLAMASSWEECHLEGELILKDEKYVFEYKKTLKADGMMSDEGNQLSCSRQFSSGFYFAKTHAPSLKIQNPTTVIYQSYGAMGPSGPVTSITYKMGELSLDHTQVQRK